jgi:hypothetical protein
MKTFDVKPAAALSFLFSELTHVEQEVLRQPYPEIKYPQIIPVDTSAPEYVESIAFKTLDFAGEPALLGDKSNDIPLVEIAAGRGQVGVHTFALGYDYSIVEVGKAMELARQSRSAAVNLLSEKPNAVRQSIEQWTDKTAFLGDDRTADVTTGLLNDANVPASATGTLLGGANETIAAILAGADKEVAANKLLTLFNNAILQVYVTQTKSVYRPTHILLPLLQFGKMATFRIPNTSETLVSYLERVLNITFEPLLHLTGIASGNKDRMMVYTKNPQFTKFHLPMGFQLQAPATANNVTFVSAGILRTAGTEIRVPKAHLYVNDV